ncbi:TPA: type II/IV secretion system protein [Candidatus Nomurabacteria bacterium]|nr:MAG: type II secretion system protein E [Parcubacteria bacterium RAAC4_OD1_1]HCY26306.1 type II/IV secretion system protein [Candidatus Nomurabacteria bacterium]
MIILEELVKLGILKEEQVSVITKIAEDKYKGNIDDALLDLKVNENELLKIKSRIFGVPIKNKEIKSISPEILKMIPIEASKNYKFVPIGLENDILEVGIVDPENIKAIDALSFITSKINKTFKLFVITNSSYKKLLLMYDNISSEVDQVLNELDSEIADAKNGDNGVVVEDIKRESDNLKPGEEEKIVEDAPIIKIVAVILRNATEGGASDIHIENVGDKVKVRFRVDGILYTSLVLPINVYNGVIARIKILSKLRLDEKRKPQDGGFSAKIDGRKIDFRVSTMPSYYGEKIAIRILDPDRGVKKLDDLGFSEDNLALVREALSRPYGLILVTGPTGSGKTTTLYSMLNELDSEKDNIVSLEDPVEYKMDGINQSQVMPEIGYTFASGLRSILRQDPDKIMVGEIRDKETAELAIQAALTGHLVFSTLHTNTSIGAIPRLIDMGIDPYLISPTLILCIAQRLARKIHPSSRHEVPIDEATKLMISKQFEDLGEDFKNKLGLKDSIYEAVPSPESITGLSGRTPIFEMFKVDKDIQNAILKNPTEGEIYKLARAKGMVTLKEDAIVKSIKGEIPLHEVYNF